MNMPLIPMNLTPTRNNLKKGKEPDLQCRLRCKLGLGEIYGKEYL